MKLENFYQKIGSEYTILLERFCNNASLLDKFVRQFPDDPVFHFLKDAVDTSDYCAVENYAHALKGVAANLGFERLQSACSALVLSVREDHLEDIPEQFETAQKEYAIIIDEIHKNS